MRAPLHHKIHQQNLWLSATRSIFWEEEKALIVSDLHFGKTGHFRKAGIPVPQHVYKEDLQRLMHAMKHFAPSQLIVVGDFFHSDANAELDWFKRWRTDMANLPIILVKGNHDILDADWYRQAAIEVKSPTMHMQSFLFSHDKCKVEEGLYSFCGHIHPGIALQGFGKQSLKFPCFYFTKDHCILPAFSKFTGATPLDRTLASHVFAIVDDELIAV